MGLFSTLLNAKSSIGTSIGPDEQDPTTHVSSERLPSTQSLPTVIQLFHQSPIPITAVDTAALALEVLDTTTAGGSKKQHHSINNKSLHQLWITPRLAPFAPLQYMAVQCLTKDEYSSNRSGAVVGSDGVVVVSPNLGLRQTSSLHKATELLIPDLGVWTCRVAGNNGIDSLLPVATGVMARSNQAEAAIAATAATSAGVSPPNSPLLFCIVVDMTQTAQLEAVEPSITMTQQALVRYLIQHASFPENTNTPASNSNPGTTSATTATTSQYQLQTVQFGLANQDVKGAAAAASVSAASIDINDNKAKSDDKTARSFSKDVRICLQICVMQSVDRSKAADDDDDDAKGTDAAMDYKTKQLRQLLSYHLRKYAAALNASLVFVDVSHSATHGNDRDGSWTKPQESDQPQQPQKNERNVQDQQPTVTTRELPIVWKALANNVPVWQYDSIEAMDMGTAPTIENANLELPDDTLGEYQNENEDTVTSTVPGSKDSTGFSLVYGPDNCNAELIETVLLRNASFPGHWDAATDSVWKVLPPPKSTSSSSAVTKTQTLRSGGDQEGDQAWLKELRDSVVLPTDASANSSSTLQTPPAKNKTADASKTPNDAAVSSFFEDLLK